jgi:hypothetical protein
MLAHNSTSFAKRIDSSGNVGIDTELVRQVIIGETHYLEEEE